jgi:hypothetical protein
MRRAVVMMVAAAEKVASTGMRQCHAGLTSGAEDVLPPPPPPPPLLKQRQPEPEELRLNTILSSLSRSITHLS